jgi:hypothetical protein
VQLGGRKLALWLCRGALHVAADVRPGQAVADAASWTRNLQSYAAYSLYAAMRRKHAGNTGTWALAARTHARSFAEWRMCAQGPCR